MQAHGGIEKGCVANQPQFEPQEALLLQPPPPMGFAELIEKPERMPASIKSILIEPHVSSRLLSTRKVNPSCSYFASVSFGSSRARPKDGPLQPPDIRATRRAESILFCSMYDLRFCVANSVTSNITNTPCLFININVRVFPGQTKKFGSTVKAGQWKVADKPVS